MRIRRLFATVVLVGALTAFTAPAAAAQPNCLGTFASGNAGPAFGPLVSGAARESQPIGRNFVGPAASSNDCSQFPDL